MSVSITVTVNGITYPLDVDPHASLLHTVRDQVGLTGAKEGCDDSECGACMMLVDGRPTNACSYLAVQADGARVITVEGLAEQDGAGERLSALQRAMLSRGGGEGHAMLSGEMFPGVVAVHTGKYAPMDLTLIDCAAGAVVRRISGMTSSLLSHQFPRRSPAPLPGTAGARLLLSQGKVYELASLTAEPRLLLPLP